LFFFFKQKTAYEIPRRDWSSDVCSSDLADLNLPGAIVAASDWRRRTSGTVVGFVSHVDSEAISQAKAAGLDQVLARSRFVTVLPDLLKGKSA